MQIAGGGGSHWLDAATSMLGCESVSVSRHRLRLRAAGESGSNGQDAGRRRALFKRYKDKYWFQVSNFIPSISLHVGHVASTRPAFSASRKARGCFCFCYSAKTIGRWRRYPFFLRQISNFDIPSPFALLKRLLACRKTCHVLVDLSPVPFIVTNARDRRSRCCESTREARTSRISLPFHSIGPFMITILIHLHPVRNWPAEGNTRCSNSFSLVWSWRPRAASREPRRAVPAWHPDPCSLRMERSTKHLFGREETTSLEAHLEPPANTWN